MGVRCAAVLTQNTPKERVSKKEAWTSAFSSEVLDYLLHEISKAHAKYLTHVFLPYYLCRLYPEKECPDSRLDNQLNFQIVMPNMKRKHFSGAKI